MVCPANVCCFSAPGDSREAGAVSRREADPKNRDIARGNSSRSAYAEVASCRRGIAPGLLRRKFGRTTNCGGCDNCLVPREIYDATIEAQKFLSCLYRIGQSERTEAGVAHVADILCGNDSAKLRRTGHDKLSTFGIGGERSRDEWIALGRQLARLGLARLDEGAKPLVSLPEEGLRALRDRTRITLTRPPSAGVARLPLTAAAAARAGAIPCDEPLFQRLCGLRKELADDRDVPPYVIFSDVSLRHMARTYPATEGELLAVPGVGERKLADFGRDFIGAISAWLEAHPRLEFADKHPRSRGKKMKTVASGLSGTVLETVRLWRAGQSVDQIAQARQLVPGTIEGHLAQALEAGEAIDVRTFYNEADELEIERAFVGHEGPALAPVFEKLGGRFSYGKLRIFQAARAAIRPSVKAEEPSNKF